MKNNNCFVDMKSNNMFVHIMYDLKFYWLVVLKMCILLNVDDGIGLGTGDLYVGMQF